MSEAHPTIESTDIIITAESVTPIEVLTWDQLKHLLKAGYNPRLSGHSNVKKAVDPDAILAGSGGAYALIPSFSYIVGILAKKNKINAPDKYAAQSQIGEHMYLDAQLAPYYENPATKHTAASWDKAEKILEATIKDAASKVTICQTITADLFTCFKNGMVLINHDGAKDVAISMTRSETTHFYDYDSKDYGMIGKVATTPKAFWHQSYVLQSFASKVDDKSAVKLLLGAVVKMAEAIPNAAGW